MEGTTCVAERRIERLHQICMGACITIVLIGALWMRLHRLTAVTFGDDELFSASWAVRLTLGELYTLRINPLFEMILRIISLGGRVPSYGLFRGWSVVCGLGSIYVIYRLGRRLGGAGLGLAAAALLSASFFHVFYCQETRYYAQVMLCSVATCASVAVWSDTRRLRWALLAAASAAATLLTHPYGVMIMPGMLMYAGLRVVWPAGGQQEYARSIARAAGHGIIALALFIVLIWPLARRFDVQTGALHWQELSSTQYTVQKKALPLQSVRATRERLQRWFYDSQPQYECYGIIAMIGVAGGLVFRRTRRMALLTGLTIYTGVYAQSYTSGSKFFARYVSALLPVYILGIAGGCAVLGETLGHVISFVQRKRGRAWTETGRGHMADYMTAAAAVVLLLASMQKADWVHAQEQRVARRDPDRHTAAAFIKAHAPGRITLYAPLYYLSKCLYMHLVGLSRVETEYVTQREALVERGVSEARFRPFNLWLQGQRAWGSAAASTSVYAGQLGAVYVVGTLQTCTSYAQAFGMIAPVDPTWQAESTARRAKIAALPACRRYDVGTADCRPYLARGWGGNEQQGAMTYCWSQDEEAALAVVPLTGETVTVVIEGWAFSEMPIDLYANQTLVTSFTARAQYEQIVLDNVPNALTNACNFLTFNFKHLKSIDRAEFDPDGRRLGLALDRLALVSTDERMIPPGGCIAVGESNAVAFLRQGWSHGERWGGGGAAIRWIEGQRAEMVVTLPHDELRRRIRIRCLPFQPPNVPPMSLALAVNDVSAGVFMLSNCWQDVVVHMPHVARQMHLTFEASAAYQPCAHGAGADARRLSVAVETVRIEP